MGSPAAGGAGRAGHREDLPALLQRPPGGDQRTAPLGGFHHHHAQREAADDPVAGGEVSRQGSAPHGMLGKHRAALLDAPAEVTVLRRIGHVHPRSQHRHGAAASGQRRLVRFAVDAAGHAADHGDAGGGQPPAQQTGHLAAVLAGCAGADHAHRRAPGRVRRPLDVKHRGRVGKGAQALRVRGVGVAQEPASRVPHPTHLVRQAVPVRKRQQPLDRGAAQPGNLAQRPATVEEGIGGVGEELRDAPEPDAPEPRRLSEGQPREVAPALTRRPAHRWLRPARGRRVSRTGVCSRPSSARNALTR